MRPVSKPRWNASVLALAGLGALLVGCGPDERTPGGADPVAADPAAAASPSLDPADEPALAVAVREGRREALAALELDGTVSRARVAVHALAGLVAADGGERELARFRDGIEGLSAARGGTDTVALSGLGHRWRGWSATDAANEKPLADRIGVLRAALAAFGREGLQAPAAAPEPIEGAPGSPFFAALPFERALRSALLAGPRGGAGTLSSEIAEARKRFEGIDWPGGFADLCMLWSAAMTAPPWRDSPARAVLEDGAVWGYSQPGGDRLSLAGIYVRRARELQQREPGTAPGAGDPKAVAQRLTTSVKAAARAVGILREAGIPGRPLAAALILEAEGHWQLGAFELASERAAAAGREARDGDLGPVTEVRAARIESMCRYRMGAFDAAYTVAQAAAARFDASSVDVTPVLLQARGELDETAAMALAESGRGRDGAELLVQVAERYARTGATEEEHQARLHAFRMRADAGDATAIEELIAFVRATELSKRNAATAASILLDHDRLDAAEEQIARTAGARSPLLLLLRARVLAARDQPGQARALFRTAERAMTGDDGSSRGPLAAEVLLHWSRFEESDGAPVEAARLAHRATFHLDGWGAPGKLDRAYARLIRLERQRMEFGRALGVTVSRFELGLAESRPGAEDAALDGLLVRLAVAGSKNLSAEGRTNTVAAAPERFHGPERQGLAADLARVVVGLPLEESTAAPLESPGGRWDLVHGVIELARIRSPRSLVNAALELAAKASPSEPELRRFACRVALRAVDPGDRRLAGAWGRRAEGLVVEADELLRLVDLRRGSDTTTAAGLVHTLGEGEVFRLIEPLGDFTVALTASRDGYVWERIDAEGTLQVLRDQVRAVSEPGFARPPTWESLEAAAKAARAAALAGLGDEVTSVVLSIGKPLGHLPLELGAPTDPSGPRLGWVTESCAERFAAADCAQPGPTPLLAFYDSPLSASGVPVRHALIQIAPAPEKARRQVHEALRKAESSGQDIRAAFGAVRQSLRAEWKRPPTPTVLPAWAAFVLRGAP